MHISNIWTKHLSHLHLALDEYKTHNNKRVEVFWYLGRMTMTSKLCEASFARHAGCGHGSDRCCGERMRPQEEAPS